MEVNKDNKMDNSMNKKMTYSNMKDGVMMKDGKMMKAGKAMMMKKDITFPNGNMVMIHGPMKMKDGSSHMLKEGDYVMMNGNMKSMSMKPKIK